MIINSLGRRFLMHKCHPGKSIIKKEKTLRKNQIYSNSFGKMLEEDIA